MMRHLIRSKRNRGQTALEYALVIGVITAGIVIVGQKLFVGSAEKESIAERVMRDAIEQAGRAVQPGK